jgi:dipeptidyl aminopeptidase/acylaminoacyl peptidase
MRVSVAGDHPSWSPDGRELVYAKASQGNSRRGLYIAAADGSGERRIVTHGQDESIDGADQFDPAWSPVSDTILYTSTRSGNSDIWATNTIGHQGEQVTDSPAYDGQAAWSPDGQSLVFVSNRDGNREIYVMNFDGGGLRRLTTDDGNDEQPSWSPGGDQIAFVSDRSGQKAVYVRSSAGSDTHRLSVEAASDTAPTWASNGRDVLFARTVGSTTTIESVSDTGGPTSEIAPAGSEVTGIDAPRQIDLAVRVARSLTAHAGTWKNVVLTVANLGPASASAIRATVVGSTALTIRAAHCEGTPFCTREQPLGIGSFRRTLSVRARRCGSFSIQIHVRGLQREANEANNRALARFRVPCR